MLTVNEIFHSIQGESTHTGRPCVFVRLTGCDLRCVWCDTPYAFHEGRKLDVDEVVAAVEQYRCDLVEITGGEPLLQEDVYPLMDRLLATGATVLLVAHELGPLAPLVDRAVVMRHGRIAYDGEPLGDHAGHDTTYGDTHSHHHPAEDIDGRADAVAPLSFPSPEDPR